MRRLHLEGVGLQEREERQTVLCDALADGAQRVVHLGRQGEHRLAYLQERWGIRRGKRAKGQGGKAGEGVIRG